MVKKFVGEVVDRCNTSTEKQSLREYVKEVAGYEPSDMKFYKVALTHPSYSDLYQESYERLEFLGDAVIGLSVAEHIYRRYPMMSAGDMTILRAKMVNKGSLAGAARYINLDKLFWSKNVKISPAQKSDRVCSNLFESLVGAIFLDLGIRGVFFLLDRTLIKWENEGSFDSEKDERTKLQEYYHRAKGFLPNYYCRYDRRKRLFVAAVTEKGKIIGSGESKSKKSAFNMAAKSALIALGVTVS